MTTKSTTKRAVPNLGETQQPLRERVRDAIQELVVTGELAPGERVIERSLVERLGVSRIPIREALRLLEADGFLTVQPRRGVTVRTLTRLDVEELFDVREALEVLAVRRATERATDAELQSLERSVSRPVKQRTRSKSPSEMRGRERFHDEIIRLAHNELLASLLAPLQGRLHWLFRLADDEDRLCREHLAIAQAMATRDPDTAARVALQHVRDNRQITIDHLFPEELTG